MIYDLYMYEREYPKKPKKIIKIIKNQIKNKNQV